MPLSPKKFGKKSGNQRRQDFRLSAHERGYDHNWNRLRNSYLAAKPLCEWCETRGQVVAGEIVDHVIPITVDPDRRLDATNLQTLCRSCHKKKTDQDSRKYGDGQARSQAQES